MRKTAIFDIDGTVFRSSLLIELTEALIRSGLFPAGARNNYLSAYRKWKERSGPYEDFIGAVIKAFGRNIKGIRRSEFRKVARAEVAIQKNRLYRHTRDLVKDLKKKGYFLLAISNSPRDILEVFCKNLGFNKVYGRIYETDSKGRFTGKLLFGDLISDKAKILSRAVAKESLTLRGSVGVGDTEADIPFLKLVQKPICFNPNSKLRAAARRRGWRVVVERKDVIYKIR